VNVKHAKPFRLLKGCTFDAKPHDECYAKWASHSSTPLDPLHILPSRGPYATNGLAAAMVLRSSTAPTPDTDLFIFGGPINFVGYYPQWGDAAVADHNHYSWYALKAHSRNTAGTVTLRSADPLEPPVVNFNYFDTGTTTDGADQADLASLVQAVNISRRALARYSDFGVLGGSAFVEEKPGVEVESEEAIGEYVKENAWGHHASCTCPIGAEGDEMAVLDERFRVRGVEGLRVVDASVFPKIPGVFIQAPIYIVSEKAAGVIGEDWGLGGTY
jgi:choline dehydrogenase